VKNLNDISRNMKCIQSHKQKTRQTMDVIGIIFVLFQIFWRYQCIIPKVSSLAMSPLSKRTKNQKVYCVNEP